MRLQLLLILCFALTAWSSQVGASAMAHCQTHETTEVLQAQTVHTVQIAAQVHSNAEHTIHHNLQDSVDHDHAVDQQSNLHDCCDQSADQQHCSGSCPSCDGCSTAHGAAMPTVWQMKATIAQQKIQYFDDFYLQSQSPTQERPPKH
ncbi:hypothetical protein EOE67_10330 [Rheinheimera riviphila]|uniref:DUF2946 domain-containing protein n=1 Tax=Rheinheimera riviphila TaxID=1834037 RepID=A0A437QSU9_9GAMM|nr:hypothetical protein [Rheinheimera riviphila]RVU37572.1 hypothetical protein EOE67_10330 [Rheinheimera riviphila]